MTTKRYKTLTKDLREAFLNYFEKNGHKRIQSSPLLPKNDPTLLFTNAGMVQFKDIFLGTEKVDYSRAASSQKCVRAGGKHNDLENVGRTARHHTFFEMMGNFSFGDYFKKDAIHFGWEFLTKTMGLPAEKLYATVYKDDDEAFGLWRDMIAIPESRIYRMDEKDNFWAMGDTGPCGPCSEILMDQGSDVGCGRASCQVGCDCDRFLELWNLVFMQFNRSTDGTLTPLPKPSIDTGMGLERVAAVVQGVKSNFETDLLFGIIEYIKKLSGKNYGVNAENDVSFRVIADHSRAATFLIADGILPSNEGRGYVLRRIIRRGARHGKILGFNKPFLHEVSTEVIRLMGDIYPEIVQKENYLKKIISIEEERFSDTLTTGMKIVRDEIEKIKGTKEKVFSGETAFKLYDTYGFPFDLTQDIATDEGLTLDITGFDNSMKLQKEKARASWKGSGEAAIASVYKEIKNLYGDCRFSGYETLDEESEILALIKDGVRVKQAGKGETVEIFTGKTSFYGRSGGQEGDRGIIKNSGCEIDVIDTIKPVDGVIIHIGKVLSGSVKEGDHASFEVSKNWRKQTASHHTATHLLHAALREVAGEHIKQAGSLVDANHLRFDFTHFTQLTKMQIEQIEQIVNNIVWDNRTVSTEILPINEAIEKGAVALFGEKYGDKVRVVTVDAFSKELCGGTHLKNTGEIGLFKIVKEESIASGIRRIEAVSREKAFKLVNRFEEQIFTASEILKTSPDAVTERLDKVIQREKELEKEIENLKNRLIFKEISDILNSVEEINGIKLLSTSVEASDAKTLREITDRIKLKIGSGVVCLAGESEDKVLFVVSVTDDLTGRFNASDIAKEVAKIVGGSGGGKADMAQAGGKERENIAEALNKVRVIVSR